MKKIVFAIIGLILTTSCSRAYDDITPVESSVKSTSNSTAARASQNKTYKIIANENTLRTLKFTSISASPSFSVAISNTGTNTVLVDVRTSTGGYFGSFSVAPGLSYTPVYYYPGGETGVVWVEVRKSSISGTGIGTVSVSN